MEVKPDPVLRNVLADEDVLILSDKAIKSLPVEQLDILIDYYTTTLETLAGSQVWDILDSLKCARDFSKHKKAG